MSPHEQSTAIGKFWQPDSVRNVLYLLRMKPEARPNLRRVVRDNCVALYLHRENASRMSWAAFSRIAGIGNGTAQRINEESADDSLATVDAICKAFGLHAWQLLIPDLDPSNPPVFVMTTAERQLYDSLRIAVREIAEQSPRYVANKAR